MVLIKTYMLAVTRTIPCTSGKSRLLMAVIVSRPSPCRAKIVSTTIAPTKRNPICRSRIVMTGISALGRAWTNKMLRSLSPLLRVVVIYCWSRTSNILVLVTRAITAPSATASVIAGRIRPRRSLPGATLGSQLSVTAKIMISNIPNQKFGIEKPAMAMLIVIVSIQVPRLSAANSPRLPPNRTASGIATNVSCAVLGSCSVIISETGRFERIHSPRSP